MVTRTSSLACLATICMLVLPAATDKGGPRPSHRKFYQVGERNFSQRFRRLPREDTLTFSGDVDKIIEMANNRGIHKDEASVNDISNLVDLGKQTPGSNGNGESTEGMDIDGTSPLGDATSPPHGMPTGNSLHGEDTNDEEAPLETRNPGCPNTPTLPPTSFPAPMVTMSPVATSSPALITPNKEERNDGQPSSGPHPALNPIPAQAGTSAPTVGATETPSSVLTSAPTSDPKVNQPPAPSPSPTQRPAQGVTGLIDVLDEIAALTKETASPTVLDIITGDSIWFSMPVPPVSNIQPTPKPAIVIHIEGENSGWLPFSSQNDSTAVPSSSHTLLAATESPQASAPSVTSLPQSSALESESGPEPPLVASESTPTVYIPSGSSGDLSSPATSTTDSQLVPTPNATASSPATPSVQPPTITVASPPSPPAPTSSNEGEPFNPTVIMLTATTTADSPKANLSQPLITPTAVVQIPSPASPTALLPTAPFIAPSKSPAVPTRTSSNRAPTQSTTLQAPNVASATTPLPTHAPVASPISPILPPPVSSNSGTPTPPTATVSSTPTRSESVNASPSSPNSANPSLPLQPAPQQDTSLTAPSSSANAESSSSPPISSHTKPTINPPASSPTFDVANAAIVEVSPETLPFPPTISPTSAGSPALPAPLISTWVACDDSFFDRAEFIEFTYSLETNSADFTAVERIRRSTEQVLTKDIANLLLPCGSRRLQAGSSLGFEGIDHVPEDSFSASDCDAVVDFENDCSVIDGILTVYISYDADFELAKYYTLTAIREILNFSGFHKQVTGLVRTQYLGPEIINPAAIETEEIIADDISRNDTNTSLVLFAVGGTAFAASVALVYYLRSHGSASSGAATQAAGSDQQTGQSGERPLSPFSEMLPSAYRFDQDGNMSAILELDDESATQRSGIVISDGGFTSTEEGGSIAVSMDGIASFNRLDSPVLGARKRRDESMDSLLELL